MTDCMQSARVMVTAISTATAMMMIASSGAAAQESSGLEEIIVTAERVEASLQDTPISISAFNAPLLDALNVVESGDIAEYTPNLRMSKTNASLNAYAIAIRGVSSGEPSLTVDPTVGIYVDGVYLGRSSAAAFEIVDLERIEVLRGPQGTLYGRNTTGGAVNIVTAKPASEFGFKQEVTVGERDLLRSATSVDTGRFGDFSAKLSYIYGERGGLVKSSITGGELGQYDQQAWRVALRWTPSDTVTVDYAYDHFQQDSNTNLSQFSHVRPYHIYLGGGYYERMAAVSSRHRLGALPYTQDHKDQDLKINGHALTLSFDLGSATLKSISSWRKFDNHYGAQDFGEIPSGEGDTLVPTPYFDGGIALPPGEYIPAFTSTDGYNKHKQWSQEFQLVGRLLDDRFGYNTGLYYFHEEGKQLDPQTLVLPTMFLAGSVPEFGEYEYFGTSIILPGTAPDYWYSSDNDAWAIYGQFDYRLTERLTAIVGLRWSVDEKAARLHNNFDDIAYGAEVVTLKASDRWSKFNPSFTLTYDLSDSVMLYAKYATGYRSGLFNARATTSTSFMKPANEETVTSWEVGGKSQWFDNRLRLNGTLFYYVYDDRQVQQFEAGSGGASTNIVNAGKSDAWGAEIELTVAPTDGLLLMLNYGHVDVDYKRFRTTLYDPVTGFPVTDDDGNSIVADISSIASTTSGGPKDSASLIAQYTFAPCTFGTVVAQIDASYASSRTYHTQLNLYDGTDSYTLWNARLTLREIPVARGDLSVALWGRNLGNKAVREYGIDFGQLGYAVNTYRELRSTGIDLRYEF